MFRVRVEESDRLAIETPGEVNDELMKILSRSGRLTFRLVAPDEENRPEKMARWEEEERVYLQTLKEYVPKLREWSKKKEQDPSFNQSKPVEPKPPSYLVRPSSSPGGGPPKRTLFNQEGTFMEGKCLAKASSTVDETGIPAVEFEFSDEDVRKFSDFTGNNVGKLVAIVLGEKILQTLAIPHRIYKRGAIPGNLPGAGQNQQPYRPASPPQNFPLSPGRTHFHCRRSRGPQPPACESAGPMEAFTSSS